MYEAHFQMHRRPFSPTADVATYVGLGPVEEAGQTLLRVVQRGSGPALVIGGAGTGKSLLCQLLAEHFGDQMHIALLSNGQLANAKALFQAMLFELGLPYRDMDENELRLSLVEFLTDEKRCPNGLLLIIDEAHILPLRVLEEIRMLTNVVQKGNARVQLVLAGGASLEEKFTSPKLDSFNQRLAARCYLEHLNREETANYIRGQVLAAGGNAENTFHADALSAVFDASDGIPRLINQVCDHALIMASLGGHVAVSGEIVQEAWADLQQLPTPWTEPAKAQSGGQHVIEFGELDDDEGPASLPFSFADTPEAAETEPPQGEVAIEHPAAESQLAEIESHIAAIDETLSPELEEQPIEVAAPEPVIATNPFAEETFEEELAVVDSYAALQETRFVNAPRVHSAEGREIAALLSTTEAGSLPAIENEAFVTTISVTESDDVEKNEGGAISDETDLAQAEPTLVDTNSPAEPAPEVFFEEPAETEELAHEEELAAEKQAELTSAVASLLHGSEEHDHVEEEVVEQSVSEYASAEEPPVQLSLVGSDDAAATAPEDDSDLIIVQEREDATETSTPHVAQGKARRQKYRQLFNRLRQA